MRQKRGLAKEPAEMVAKEIRRANCKHSSAEEKIRVVREDLPPNVGSAQDLLPMIRLARAEQKPSQGGLAD
jgi:hypothetical protein